MTELDREMTKLIEKNVRAQIEADLASWEADELAAFLRRRPEGQTEYLSGSQRRVKRVYTAADVADISAEDISLPGRFPFTRGPYPTMYRGRPWTMRQIAGFGTPDETNERFQYLIAQGQTGLSVDFDMPTLMGFDSDNERCIGEVGREGVAIDVLEDMDLLLKDIDLEQISVSMTINPSAWILLAMYIAVAEARGLISTSCPAPSRTTSSRNTSPRRNGSTLRAEHAARTRLDRLRCRPKGPLQPDQHQRLSHI